MPDLELMDRAHGERIPLIPAGFALGKRRFANFRQSTPSNSFLFNSGRNHHKNEFGVRRAPYQIDPRGALDPSGGVEMAKKILKKGKKLSGAKTLATVNNMRSIISE
jgi:hypothetical protein